MAAVGCSISIADINEKTLAAALEDLKEHAGRIMCTKCDVSKEEDVKAAVDATMAKFGAIHVAIACAGTFGFTPIMGDMPLNMDTVRKIMAVNLMGAVYVAKYCAVAMSKNDLKSLDGPDRGVIIFVSSVLATEGGPAGFAYSASKACLLYTSPSPRDVP